MTSQKITAFLLPSLYVFIFFAMAKPAFSHGTVTSPPSRVWICYQESPESPDSPACVASVAQYGTQHLYDWNAIRQGEANENHTAVIPNGTLASGGNPAIYGGMDQVRSDWVKTSVAPGPYTVTWTNSAPHATEYYEVYITNEDWTPDQPLRWDNITLLVQTPFSPAEASVDIPVVLPNRTGHHVIYSIWQRADSPEAFYSASDVDFGDNEVAMDKKVTVNEDLEVANDLTVILDIYFPSLANGAVQNLTIDGQGKVTVDSPTLLNLKEEAGEKQYVYAINKYNFSTIMRENNFTVAREGLHFK